MRKFYLLFTLGLLLYGGGIGYYLLTAPGSLPADLQGSPADPATFMTAKQVNQAFMYSRIKDVVYFIGGPLEWAIYLFILGTGLSAFYRRWVQPVKGSFFQIVIFLILLTFTTTLLHFPLDYYSFELRQEYGISTEPFADWMRDNVKSFWLSIVMTAPLVWLLYYMIKKSPKRWWFWVWLLSIPIMLFFMYIQPVVLDPIFHEFSPLKDQQLKKEILKLAEEANIPTRQVYEVDMSKKTNALNAYVNGIGSNTRIVLWDTTLKKLKTDEVLFIMAHEMGHYALKHMFWLFLGSIGMILVALFFLYHSLHWVVHRWGSFWGIRTGSDMASLPIILLLLSILSFVSMPIQNAVSRQYEHAADEYAMNMFSDSDAAIRTFQRLAVEGLSEVNPPGLVKFVLYSHPTLYERILYVKNFKK